VPYHELRGGGVERLVGVESDLRPLGGGDGDGHGHVHGGGGLAAPQQPTVPPPGSHRRGLLTRGLPRHCGNLKEPDPRCAKYSGCIYNSNLPKVK
jgi:hypothetical protein